MSSFLEIEKTKNRLKQILGCDKRAEIWVSGDSFNFGFVHSISFCLDLFYCTIKECSLTSPSLDGLVLLAKNRQKMAKLMKNKN